MDTSTNIIPAPKEKVLHDGRINLEGGWEIIAQGKAAVALQEQFQRKLTLTSSKTGKQFHLCESASLDTEAYEIKISKNKVTVAAADERGFYYALQTLSQLEYMRTLPMGIIKDKPALQVRGFYLDLLGVRKLDFTSIKRIIEQAGELKLNTIFIEYGDRFPYLKSSEISAIDALTREQIKTLIKLSKDNYIKVIPVLQSFGHFEYALQHDTYSELREVKDVPEQLCPSNPNSLEFFKKLAEEILEIHVDSDYFHIGGDETRQLGVCPQCREKVISVGKDGLFLEYIDKVCKWVKSQGKTPIIWDDMLCAYPDILDKLDRDIVIMYWDYWGADVQVPYLVPRYRPAGTKEIPKCIAYDQRWDREWSTESHPAYMHNFAEPFDFELDLGDDYIQRFKQYLGPKFPKLINSFPYLQFYIDKGFSVIGSPTCLGEIADMPDGFENQSRSVANIKGFAHNLEQHGGMGMITTAWFNLPPEYLYHGIILTAHFAWNGNDFSTV